MLMNGIIKHNLHRYCSFLKRCKHKDTHWSIARKRKTACDKALQHFDEFYAQVLGKEWPSVRHGLLTTQKYVAVLNNFSDVDEIKTKLEANGALNVRTLFNLEKQYICENYEKFKKKRRLDEIWKLDKELDQKANENIVGDNEDVTDIYKSQSLEKNLSQADIDFTRMICSENAAIANLNEFMPVTRIKGREDWISDPTNTDRNYNNTELSTTISKEYDINFPEHLNVYCYESGNHADFSAPRNGSTGVLNYYLMNGGSLLPVLALDIREGDRVLDLCASPGGKSYLALQTLYPDIVICNDVTKSRVDRIYNVMSQYLYDLQKQWLERNKLGITLMDGRVFNQEDFDKIMVDVPCTTDRHSLREPENNIFAGGRIKERFKLPELQCELLVHALKLVKIGGNVVYSTCSISPVQNDGVVHMALKRIWEETNLEIGVKDLTPALLQTASIYKLSDPKLMKYGHLILPNLQMNFGPTYFCKLHRIK